MNQIRSEKKSALKYLSFFLLFVMPVFLFACGGPKHMISMDVKPTLGVKPGKAVLVITRTPL
jgi:hypothetical protein